jgi:hypothetical protein
MNSALGRFGSLIRPVKTAVANSFLNSIGVILFSGRILAIPFLTHSSNDFVSKFEKYYNLRGGAPSRLIQRLITFLFPFFNKCGRIFVTNQSISLPTNSTIGITAETLLTTFSVPGWMIK